MNKVWLLRFGGSLFCSLSLAVSFHIYENLSYSFSRLFKLFIYSETKDSGGLSSPLSSCSTMPPPQNTRTHSVNDRQISGQLGSVSEYASFEQRISLRGHTES